VVTHKTTRAGLDHALEGIRATGVTLQEPVAIRIEEV
jgi:homoserine dehydrogenase